MAELLVAQKQTVGPAQLRLVSEFVNQLRAIGLRLRQQHVGYYDAFSPAETGSDNDATNGSHMWIKDGACPRSRRIREMGLGKKK